MAIEAAQRHHVKRAMLDIIRVDIVPDTDDDPFPLLGITVCNRGGATAVLHELLIEDTKVWVFARRGGPRARPVSWTYGIDIGAEPPQHWRISQSIESDDTDCFRCGSDCRASNRPAKVCLSTRFVSPSFSTKTRVRRRSACVSR